METKVSFTQFYVAVARMVEAKCGLSPDDLPDIDFRAFYPESGTIEDYKGAVRECVNAVLAGASYPFIDEEYES